MDQVVITFVGGAAPRLSARQLVSTPEDDLAIEPHAPGFIQQISDKSGLAEGPYDLLSEPQIIRTDVDADALLEMLVDPDRRLPIFVITVREDAADLFNPPRLSPDLRRAIKHCACGKKPPEFARAISFRQIAVVLRASDSRRSWADRKGRGHRRLG